MQELSFIVTDQGFLPEGIKNTLKQEIPKHAGKHMHLTLAEAMPLSSNPQRRYYFAVIVEGWKKLFMDNGTNLTRNETHEWLKRHVGKLIKEVVTPDGEVTEILRSYKRLERPEAELYHLQCRQKAADYGLDLPEPNEGKQL